MASLYRVHADDGPAHGRASTGMDGCGRDYEGRRTIYDATGTWSDELRDGGTICGPDRRAFQAGHGPELQIRDQMRRDQMGQTRLTLRARSMPVCYDMTVRDHETDDAVQDCSEWTSHERLERKKEGIERSRIETTLEDWQ